MKQDYPILRSTLEGIFSLGVGLSEDEVAEQLERDLQYRPFRDALGLELKSALEDESMSWQLLLRECDVEEFDDDVSARAFVVKYLQLPATKMARHSSE